MLLLYDCCHAIPTTTGITGRGVKEFLAACGFESIAPEVGHDSFTHALIQELGKASYSSISVGELYGRLIDRLRTWKPCISKNELGQMKLNSCGKPLYERSKRKTPIHCALSNEPKRRSIVLSPLPGPHELPVQSGPSSTDQPRKRRRYIDPNESDDESEGTEESTECTQVILSIRVDTEQFDLDAWLEWIKDVPPEATKIKVEGIYGSLSTLLLLRMPITSWSLLPNDTAYSFIGFVTTENLAPNFRNLALNNVGVQGDRPTEETDNAASDLTDSFIPFSLFGEASKESKEIHKDVMMDPDPVKVGSRAGLQSVQSDKTSQGNRTTIGGPMEGDLPVMSDDIVVPVNDLIQAFHKGAESTQEIRTAVSKQAMALQVSDTVKPIQVLQKSLAESEAQVRIAYSEIMKVLGTQYSKAIENHRKWSTLYSSSLLIVSQL